MLPLFKLLRPHQYLKNGFVLLGVIFAHRWDAVTLLNAAVVFVAFCAMASAVYVLNDLLDVEADRQHPTKKHRPIANATVSVRMAEAICGVLALVAVAFAAWVSSWAVLLVMTYAVFNIAYSWRLKHVVILDVFIISAGFMLRILAGTIGIGIAPSHWLLLCGMMVTLFLGFAKRRAELLVLESHNGLARSATRRVLDDYSPVMLEQFIAVSAACTILSYGLYTVSAETISKHGSGDLIYTLPFVIYGIFRYLFLLHHRAKGNDTARDLLTDFHLMVTIAAWLGITVGLLW